MDQSERPIGEEYSLYLVTFWRVLLGEAVGGKVDIMTDEALCAGALAAVDALAFREGRSGRDGPRKYTEVCRVIRQTVCR